MLPLEKVAPTKSLSTGKVQRGPDIKTVEAEVSSDISMPLGVTWI